MTPSGHAAAARVRWIVGRRHDIAAHVRSILRWRRDEPITDVQVERPYPLDGWRDANPQASSRFVEGGISVTTDPRRWSYCLEYGPLRAPVTGSYRFALSYELMVGAIALGVLNRDKKRWLPASSTDVTGADGRTQTVSVDLWAGQCCWLMISNNPATCDGESRFIVRTLTGSMDVLQWRALPVRAFRRWWPTTNGRTSRLVRRALGGRPLGANRMRRSWLISRVDAFLCQLRDRIRARIVCQTPEYRRLEAQLQQLAPLGDLDHVYRLLQERRPDDLHLNGCGDFQLMAREHWFELRGYPEFQTFSMNIDGLFSSVAHYAGINERVLESPCHIYHLEHEVGSGWTPEGEALLRQRIAERGVTWLDAKDVFLWSAYMHWLGRPMIFNTSDWGFGALTMIETVVEPSRQSNRT